MHEISLVQGLFSQLHELAAENGASRIISVTMEIGSMSGVVVDSFQFGFDILSADDDLVRDARLIINVPDVDYTCSDCGHIETRTTKPDQCPQCGDFLLIPKGGDDLLLRQVELE